MTILPQENYGFNYTLDGSEYAFHVPADSEQQAKRKVAAMSQAIFFGKLELDIDKTPNVHSDSLTTQSNPSIVIPITP